MASLRTRLLAGVLLLSAAGLVLLGAVTYAEQRSFLQGRVDHEALTAWPAVSQLLDREGFRASASAPTSGVGASSTRTSGKKGPGGPPAGGGGGVNLPPGTYGQRREASGKVIGRPVIIKYSTTESVRPAPQLPAQVPLGKLLSVDSVGTEDVHYRVYALHDPEDSGITVVAVPLTDVDQTLQRLLVVEALVIAGVLAALGLTAFFVVRLGLRPLNRMEVTAGEIAGGELSRRVSPATARTEVGRLGLALNAMLDRLEEAFAERQASEHRLRQFLADASHELRTPLASIRGYAELFRMGATTSASETEMSMRRIEDESRRMGILVEDLLTLARLDETPELRRQPVDLAKLARDAAKDAQATAPERPIAVVAPDSAVVSGDPHQLHQVVANLMRNALVHTPPDTAIEVDVRSEPDGQSVTISVRDHGPGLPPGASERLFDRFWRSEGGRERGRAGAGLGLAIVREIVLAHHGEIHASNAVGGGAKFVLTLPVSAEPPASHQRRS
jgi:two-component system, OmpR family, sensor kinase